MYAIFEIGGKQYKATAGDVIRVEKLPDAEGAKIEFDKVLALNDGKETHIGTPYLDAASVNATVTAVGKGEKVIVFKYKAKKGYRKKQGHRQPFTEIEIESASLAGKTVFKKEEPKKADKPAPKEKGEEEKQEELADAEKPEAEDDGKKPDKAPAETETVGDDDKKPDEALLEKETAGDDGKKPDEAPVETETAGDDGKKLDKPDAAPTETKAGNVMEDADGDGKKLDKPDAAPVETEVGKAAKAADDDGKKSDKPDAAVAPPKMTKADIMAKLDELGASYAKSAKKDELLAILVEAEKK